MVITHSYFFCGFGEHDILSRFTNDQTCFSYIGVRGFFIISGYLIFQSMQRSTSLNSYYWKRFLRLFPGLIIVLLLTVCLGVFVFNGTLKDYVSSKEMWSYVPNNLSLYNLQFGISGVLNSRPLNGSLWTIRYEFSFYILISLLFFFRYNKKFIKNLLIFLFIFLLIGKLILFEKLGVSGISFSNSMSLNLGLYFISGSVLASINVENFKFKFPLTIIGIMLLAVSFYYQIFLLSQYIILPVIVVLAGISSTKYINTLSHNFGDISYGIYIYSFPIQATLMYFFAFSCMELMSTSLLLSIIFGILSWNFIEKKSLRLKTLSLRSIKLYKL